MSCRKTRGLERGSGTETAAMKLSEVEIVLGKKFLSYINETGTGAFTNPVYNAYICI